MVPHPYYSPLSLSQTPRSPPSLTCLTLLPASITDSLHFPTLSSHSLMSSMQHREGRGAKFSLPDWTNDSREAARAEARGYSGTPEGNAWGTPEGYAWGVPGSGRWCTRGGLLDDLMTAAPSSRTPSLPTPPLPLAPTLSIPPLSLTPSLSLPSLSLPP